MDISADRAAARLRVCPNGPILIRGEVEIIGEDGEVVPVRRRVSALCRCGHSSISPWCDGTHRSVAGFGRPARRERTTP